MLYGGVVYGLELNKRQRVIKLGNVMKIYRALVSATWRSDQIYVSYRVLAGSESGVCTSTCVKQETQQLTPGTLTAPAQEKITKQTQTQ